MKLETNKVKSHSLEYRNWHNDKTQYITLTEWNNGEGCDVSIDDDKMFALSHQEMAALRILFAKYDLGDNETEEEKNAKNTF